MEFIKTRNGNIKVYSKDIITLFRSLFVKDTFSKIGVIKFDRHESEYCFFPKTGIYALNIKQMSDIKNKLKELNNKNNNTNFLTTLIGVINNSKKVK